MGLHESTPQSVLEGCTTEDRAWMFSSWPAVVVALTGAEGAPITAEKVGGWPPASVTRAWQVEPDLHGLSTSFPLWSRMPRLHGVFVRSALAVAVMLTSPPTTGSVVVASRW